MAMLGPESMAEVKDWSRLSPAEKEADVARFKAMQNQIKSIRAEHPGELEGEEGERLFGRADACLVSAGASQGTEKRAERAEALRRARVEAATSERWLKLTRKVVANKEDLAPGAGAGELEQQTSTTSSEAGNQGVTLKKQRTDSSAENCEDVDENWEERGWIDHGNESDRGGDQDGEREWEDWDENRSDISTNSTDSFEDEEWEQWYEIRKNLWDQWKQDPESVMGLPDSIKNKSPFEGWSGCEWSEWRKAEAGCWEQFRKDRAERKAVEKLKEKEDAEALERPSSPWTQDEWDQYKSRHEFGEEEWEEWDRNQQASTHETGLTSKYKDAVNDPRFRGVFGSSTAEDATVYFISQKKVQELESAHVNRHRCPEHKEFRCHQCYHTGQLATACASVNQQPAYFRNRLESLNLTHYQEERKVRSLTYGELLEFYGILRPELLQTDCEGQDFAILRGLIEHVWKYGPDARPGQIVFEACSGRKYMPECLELLRELFKIGYKLEYNPFRRQDLSIECDSETSVINVSLILEE